MTEVLIPRNSRSWLLAASTGALGALSVTGWRLGWLVLCILLLAGLFTGRAVPILIGIAIILPGLFHDGAELAPGPVSGQVVLTGDVRAGDHGYWALGTLAGTRVFLDLDEEAGRLGDVLDVEADVTPNFVDFDGRPRPVLDVESASVVAVDRGIYTQLGSAVRRHVAGRLVGVSEGHSLLAGFLVGDTSGLAPTTVDAMRLTGLSHFVAVSGSNVALFLGFVAVLGVPLGVGPKRRAALGLLALPVFVVATGLEPSVIRASAMAAVMLIGVLVGIRLEVWQVVSVAMLGVLAFDPWLIRSVGFQLSVGATSGVVLGSRWPMEGGVVPRALVVTLGAQIAVAPLLVTHFGSIPLLSPLANLLAAPLVALSTVVALVGVVGFSWVLAPASWIASVVIGIAHLGATWPQVGWLGLVLGLIGVASAVFLLRRRKEFAILVVAVLIAVAILPRGSGIGPGQVVVIDVGQGDAILLSGGDDRYVLVDGGRDPSLLLRRLRELRVRRLDLVVVSHGDADHVGGLTGLAGQIPISAVWERTNPHETGSSEDFLETVRGLGTRVEQPRVGDSWSLGPLIIEVLGPARRFASGNDQSIVLLVRGALASMLLTGDIEVVGQAELGDVRADYLKVPHHGAGTTDRSWLERADPQVAIISVGANDFGHPVPWVLDLLIENGATVRRTDIEGNIVVDLGS